MIDSNMDLKALTNLLDVENVDDATKAHDTGLAANMLTADNMNYFVVLLPSADQVFVSRATYEVVYQKSLEEYERLANLPRRYILRASPQLLSSDPRVQKPYGYQGDGKKNTGKKRRVDNDEEADGAERGRPPKRRFKKLWKGLYH